MQMNQISLIQILILEYFVSSFHRMRKAMTQERRRYGFVLERQCSLAKHWIAYHTSGKNCLSSHLDSWDEVSSSREFLPPNVENMFAKNIKVV